MLSIDTITREQIIKLIDNENKRKQQNKEASIRFKETHKEKGDLCTKRAEYRLQYYKNKILKDLENSEN